jgi:hypothetical protein
MPSTQNYITQDAGDARYQTLGGLSSATPTTVDAGDTGTAGVSSSGSRADHEHPVSVTSAQLVPAATIAAWIDYVPTNTNLTLGNGVQTARYMKVGRTVSVYYKLTRGTTTSFTASIQFGLPFAASASAGACGAGHFLDFGTQNFMFNLYIPSLGGSSVIPVSTAGGNFDATNPITWATSDVIEFSVTYEAAS